METYTDKTKEEIIAILRDIVVAIDNGGITDLRSVVSKVEETIGQKYGGGYWCPPSCTPTADEVEQMTEDKRREEAEQRDASLLEE